MWLLYYETQQSYVATNIAHVINIETYKKANNQNFHDIIVDI